MRKRPEVCILPVAGLSTRNLPSTKAIHKGFLTLNSKPIIQYAVDACAEIGIKEIIFIHSDQSCKEIFERHYSTYPWLENHLLEKKKLELLKVVQDIIPQGMKFSFAEQKEPKGNGHAILMAKELVGDRDFIVMWPDDVYINIKGDGILKQLVKVYEEEGGMVENIIEFPKEEMIRYGALIDAERDGNKVHAKDIIEKPKLEDVPSNYASMGPYIMPNSIMDYLPKATAGLNGEINLTDAMHLACLDGVPLTGVICDVVRYDCGTNDDLAKANLKLSLMESSDLRRYCQELLDTMPMPSK
ncbi:MAG: hypothetical protein LBL47_04300 [Lactobacillus sp.]|nr:hypothetical protein [Lactobacillus sp.]